MHFVDFIAGLVLVSSASSRSVLEVTKPKLFPAVKYITDLEKIYNFQTIVFFQEDNFILRQRDTRLRKYIQKDLKVPVISLTKYPGQELKYFVGNNTISLVFFERVHSDILNIVSKTLRGIHYTKIVFIMPSTHFGLIEVQYLLRWCWTEGMVNVNVLLVGADERIFIYGSKPFVSNSLVNLTTKSADEYFVNRLKNFCGYKFRSPVKEDMPRVFTLPDKKMKNSRIYDGIGGRTLISFIEKYNGTFEELYIPNSSKNVEMRSVLRFVLNKNIDISMHPYGNFNRSNYGASYPYLLTRYCLVVPVKNEVPAYMYLIKPFKSSTWAAIIFSIFYISTCLFIAAVITHGKKDFGHALCNCLCGILNISMPITSFPSTKRSLLIYGQVILLGFILSNLYLTKLFSFLTKPFYGRQLETLDEIYNSGLKILIEEFETLTVKGMNFPRKYDDMLLVKDADTVALHFKALNASYGYAMTTEQWALYRQQQNYMHQKRLRVTNVCFGQYLVSFPMQFDSPFMDLLSMFLLDLQAAGLHNRWHLQIFRSTVWAGLLHRFRDTKLYDVPTPLSMENLTLMWLIYIYGNLCAVCGFLLEHVRFWYSKHYCERCHKVHIRNCKM